MDKNQIKLYKKYIVSLLVFSVLLFNILPNLTTNRKSREISYAENLDDDIDAPKNLKTSTIYYSDTNGGANKVFIKGDFAYIADTNWGLAIVNISDPTNPGVPLYRGWTAADAKGLYIEGNFAYIASGGEFVTIDITDPTSPKVPSELFGLDNTEDVYVKGNYAYLADSNSGLAIINISDPKHPGPIVYAPSWSGDVHSVYVSGNYAYLAVEDKGLAIIDVSDPTNPGSPIFASNWSGRAHDLFIDNNFAYIANSDVNIKGLTMINVSDPLNPGIPTHINTVDLGTCKGVYISGTTAYLTQGYAGLIAIDISDPTNPGIPIYETTGDAEQLFHDVFIKGDYAYIADHHRGLAIVHTREMFGPLLTNTPNDLIVDFGYTGESVSWTATDRDPDTYTVELVGTGILTGPTAWSNDTEITFDIPDSLPPGNKIFNITFTDIYSNSISDSVEMEVRDTMDPIIINNPSDFTIIVGYTEESVSWTVTDHTPNTYTLSLEGTGIVAGPTAWLNRTDIMYNIPLDLTIGEYNYTANFTDDYNHSVSDTVTMTIIAQSPPAIPYGNFYLVFLFIGVITVVLSQIRRKRFHTK